MTRHTTASASCSGKQAQSVSNSAGVSRSLYADDVNILGGGTHTLQEKAEALLAATREIGLEVSTDKTKYMVMSRVQNAGRIQSVRIDNNTFEMVEGFKYLGKTSTN